MKTIGTAIIAITVLLLYIGYLVQEDINQAKEVREFIQEQQIEDKQIHDNFCAIAKSREAPVEYLESRNCK